MSGAALLMLFLLLLYATILGWLAAGFKKTSVITTTRKAGPVPVTVIVCARNEGNTIQRCIETIVTQNYPAHLLELILVNDASSDNTMQTARAVLAGSGITYRIIENQERLGKKQSITRAMTFAANPLVVLRDADTFTISENWLRAISEFYQCSGASLIIAPLALQDGKGLLWALQAAENKLLTMFTSGSANYNKSFLCNGANLAFTQEVFRQTGGYSSHIELESGDDIFFMEDVKKIHGAKIVFLKNEDALVKTYHLTSISGLLAQRTRWASKFRYNNNRLNLTVALLVFMVNTFWICCLAAALIPPLHLQCLLFVFFKLTIDILLLFLASGFGRVKGLNLYVPLVAMIYPFYAVSVAVLSIFVRPAWK